MPQRRGHGVGRYSRIQEGLCTCPTSETLGRSRIKYEWETTKKTKLGVAITGSQGSSAGGLSYSIRHDNSAGLSKTHPNNIHKIVKVQ